MAFDGLSKAEAEAIALELELLKIEHTTIEQKPKIKAKKEPVKRPAMRVVAKSWVSTRQKVG